MLKPNRYLKEIGIDENYWLFNKKENEGDSRYEEDEEGLKEAETWGLDTTLRLIIYTQVRYFKDVGASLGTPSCFLFNKDGSKKDSEQAHKDWIKTLDYIIETFKLMIIDDEEVNKYFGVEDRYINYQSFMKKYKKRLEKGMKMFIEYYRCFWW